jgi:hypothetical protein
MPESSELRTKNEQESSHAPLESSSPQAGISLTTRSSSTRLPLASRSFVLILTPIVAASIPSLLFCTLALALWMHTAPATTPTSFHLPPLNLWDHLFALQLSVYQWIARWNSAATLAATGFFASTLLFPRWRNYALLALIPYGLLLCADFTLRWL